MESTINQQSDIRFDLEVTLTHDELKPYLDNAYREAQKKVSMKGFRKGHVPVNLIRKLHGRAIDQEAMEEAVQQEFGRYAREKDIRPIGNPAITHLHRTDDGGLHFTVAYEVMPNIELGDYKGLPARRLFHNVTEEEVEQELQRARESMGTMVEAEKIEDDSYGVTIDLRKFVDGQVTDEGIMKDVRVYLGNPQMNQELRDKLIGSSVGDTFEVDLPTGEEEEPIHYQVTVTDVKKIVLPEVDDELARKLLGVEDATPERLREEIRRSIEIEYDRRYSSMMRDELIEALIERHQFPVPGRVLNEVLGSLLEERTGGKKENLPTEEELEAFVMESQPMAERVARWAMLRDLIIEREDLRADEVDYEGLASIEAQRTGIDEERILAYMKKTERYGDRIRAEKALQLLEDYAIITEVEDREAYPEGVPADGGQEETEERPAES